MITKRGLKRTLLASPSAIRDSRAVRWVFRAQEKLETRFGEGRDSGYVAPDGFPIPPPGLRVAISGIADARNHIEAGVLSRAALESILTDNGVDISNLGPILDFGSGAGRVLRQWDGVGSLELHGCDYNVDAIAWASENLPFATWAANKLDPPLPYSDNSFDLVYALSVFTHFPNELQLGWMTEMARVVRPGKWLIFTTMGDSFREQLTGDQKVTFERDGFVVHFPGSAGSNMCSAYHSPAYARKLAGEHGFEPIISIPVSENSPYPQDMHLVRRAS